MNIALIAHDKKKELMVQFCIAYCGIFAKHKLCATATTGKLVADTTGLDIYRFMSAYNGGIEQIASRIAYNEIDLLLFFRDSVSAVEDDGAMLLRLCDMHNIPVATNMATAEILVRAMDRGDMEWREISQKRNEGLFG